MEKHCLDTGNINDNLLMFDSSLDMYKYFYTNYDFHKNITIFKSFRSIDGIMYNYYNVIGVSIINAELVG